MTTPLGFDPKFLADIDVPLPDRAGLVVLPYTHFSVSIDPERRLAAVTGVNIDGANLKDVERGDDWRLDDRLPASQQAGSESPDSTTAHEASSMDSSVPHCSSIIGAILSIGACNRIRA